MTGQPLTVLLYVDSEVFGGSEQVVLQLLRGLDRARWRPALLHHSEPGLKRLIEGAHAVDVSTLTVPRVTDRSLLLRLPGLLSVISKARPAVFHAHLNWPLSCKYGIVAAALSRVPAVVATLHLFPEALMNRNVRTQVQVVSRAVHRYLPVARHVRDRLASLGIPERQLRVIRNGIDPRPFLVTRDPELRARLSPDGNAPIVLTSARLARQKALDVLLAAATQVPDALFLIAGEGPERSALEARASQLALSSRVRFLGARQDIAELLAVCDLFVLPSLVEGLPISVLEAMAAARPVVASRIGGTDEVVVDGGTGVLVAAGDAEALAAAIRRLLADPEYARRMGQAGRDRVYGEFSLSRMIEGVEAAYEELLPG